MSKTVIISVLIVLAGLFACASLDEGGSNVRYSFQNDVPEGCKMLGKLDVDEGSSAATIDPNSFKLEMRNMAFKMGGDYLVIDSIDYLQDEGGGYYGGSGRVYKCQ